MPFIPHTTEDEVEMLAAIGARSIADLFDEIPLDLRAPELSVVPPGVNQPMLDALMSERAQQNTKLLNFIGAGSYQHHIPPAVWDIALRGEFLTSYTPYQPEASQGTLQLLYEYQTMMTRLTGMEVSNASMYDGGSATAEAVLMALRCHKKDPTRRVLVAGSVHPHYRQVLQSHVQHQGVEVIELPLQDGVVDPSALKPQDFAAIVIQQPNFLGCLESVDALTDWAHSQQAMVIAVVNPTSLGLLREPGQWGERGADIVVGDGQPLGIPMMGGGPYFGFLCCRQEFVREMPGRLVGRTLDTSGKEGFVLTLQAREQHIRRSKAKSNICTNQGLLVTAATIYMSVMGPEGLRRVALQSHQRTSALVEGLTRLPGIERVYNTPFFHEAVIRFREPIDAVLARCQQAGIQPGLPLRDYYPALSDCLLVCATEHKTMNDIQRYIECFS